MRVNFKKMGATVIERKALLAILSLFLLLQLVQGQDRDQDYYIDKYTTKVFQPEYAIRFKNVEDQKSFKQLREFYREKETLLAALKSKIATTELESATDTSEIVRINNLINPIKKTIADKKENDTVEIKESFFFDRNLIFPRRYEDSIIKSPVSEVRDQITSKENRILVIRKQSEQYSNLKSNLANVKEDIDKCSTQIDSALAPEYQQQDFRKIISICFSALIGLLLSIFFYIVYQRSDNNLSKELLSGNGLQFITLFVLIIAVILFGILSILQSSELAAILSGISGYILGKGTQKDLSSAIQEGKTIQNQPPPINPVNPINPLNPQISISPQVE